MTEIQFIHHEEQMESARQEFTEIWLDVQATDSHRWAGRDVAFVELIGWRVFLRAKGLLK